MQQKKPNRFYSKKQETKSCEYLGIKTTKNSGATLFDKGDGKDDIYLAEFKTLTKPQKSHTIQKEWLEKNQEEAFSTGREMSVLFFDFGTQQVKDQYAILSMSDFKKLMANYKEGIK